MTENITAVITLDALSAVEEVYEEGNRAWDASRLDLVLTTLRKHGISPKYFEYEPERDETTPLTYEPASTEFKDVEVLAEVRETKYDSREDETRVTIHQVIKGSIS